LLSEIVRLRFHPTSDEATTKSPQRVLKTRILFQAARSKHRRTGARLEKGVSQQTGVLACFAGATAATTQRQSNLLFPLAPPEYCFAKRGAWNEFSSPREHRQQAQNAQQRWQSDASMGCRLHSLEWGPTDQRPMKVQWPQLDGMNRSNALPAEHGLSAPRSPDRHGLDRARPPSHWPEHALLLLHAIFRFVSRILCDDGLHDPVAQVVSHMDFEIYWPFRPALSAPEPLASPIHNNGCDLFGRFVDNDLPNLEGQRDVENFEPGEAATFPFLLLDANLAGQVQATNCRCNLSGFIARDIKRVLGADND
jgi:hypothetical protein